MIRNSKAGGIFSFVAADFLSLAPWQQLCTYDSTEWLFLQGWGLAAHLLLPRYVDHQQLLCGVAVVAMVVVPMMTKHSQNWC